MEKFLKYSEELKCIGVIWIVLFLIGIFVNVVFGTKIMIDIVFGGGLLIILVTIFHICLYDKVKLYFKPRQIFHPW